MNPATKLAAYGMILAAMVGGGAAIGAAAGPIDVGDGGHEAHEPTTSAPSLPAGGLLVAQDGYELRVSQRTLASGAPQLLTFVIANAEGAPLLDYQELHDRDLHLIVVSSDLAAYAHVHPARDDDGTWTVELPPLEPGVYRAYADFQPTGGDQLTLGVDLTVPGPLGAPTPLAPRLRTTVAGFDVSLDGATGGGDMSTLTVTVRRGGAVVTTEPYLGAAGHLVAIRDGDLAYLHVHPLGEEPVGPVSFGVDFPSAGTYGLFFDFSVDGEVHTASFVVDADRDHGSGH